MQTIKTKGRKENIRGPQGVCPRTSCRGNHRQVGLWPLQHFVAMSEVLPYIAPTMYFFDSVSLLSSVQLVAGSS